MVGRAAIAGRPAYLRPLRPVPPRCQGLATDGDERPAKTCRFHDEARKVLPASLAIRFIPATLACAELEQGSYGRPLPRTSRAMHIRDIEHCHGQYQTKRGVNHVIKSRKARAANMLEETN